MALKDFLRKKYENRISIKPFNLINTTSEIITKKRIE